MDTAHVHLLLNHVPVLGAIFGLLLLTFAAWKGRDESTKVSLAVFVVVGLASLVVYLTGEAAEELVEGLPEFSEAIAERHEEAALVATVGAGLLGAVGLVGLWAYRRREVAGWFRALSLVLALGVVGLMGWTANLGGQIRHTEIRPTASGAPADGIGAGRVSSGGPAGVPASRPGRPE